MPRRPCNPVLRLAGGAVPTGAISRRDGAVAAFGRSGDQTPNVIVSVTSRADACTAPNNSTVIEQLGESAVRAVQRRFSARGDRDLPVSVPVRSTELPRSSEITDAACRPHRRAIMACRSISAQEGVGTTDHSANDEVRVGHCVAAPKSTWLAGQTVQPLQSEPLHPRGALRVVPARYSKAAPTPTITAFTRPRCACIHISCFGQPRPTHTTAAPDPLIISTMAPSSCSVSGRNGGEYVPAIISPGCSSRRARCKSSSVCRCPHARRRSRPSRCQCAISAHQIGSVDSLLVGRSPDGAASRRPVRRLGWQGPLARPRRQIRPAETQ